MKTQASERVIEDLGYLWSEYALHKRRGQWKWAPKSEIFDSTAVDEQNTLSFFR